METSDDVPETFASCNSSSFTTIKMIRFEVHIRRQYITASSLHRLIHSSMICWSFLCLLCLVENCLTQAWTTIIPHRDHFHLSHRNIGFLLHGDSSRSTNLFAWSCFDSLPQITSTQDTNNTNDANDEPSSSSSSTRTTLNFDLSSPREWLEYRQHRSGGNPGAYTVIRCDYYPYHSGRRQRRRQNLESDSNPWHIWGKQYHINRLKQSYRILIEKSIGSSSSSSSSGQKGLPNLDDNHDWEPILSEASSSVDTMISRLLDETENHLASKQQNSNEVSSSGGDDDEDSSSFITVMLTLLYEPSTRSDVDSPSDGDFIAPIRIHGHLFTGETVTKYYDYNSKQGGRVASLAIPTTSSTPNESNSLPNRYENSPKAKLSSWCSQRRPLEKQFKETPNGTIDDVILVKGNSNTDLIAEDDVEDDDWCLLEGLTSNLFVVYPDGIIRTPSNDVLDGYARQLILNHAAKKCGLKVDTDHPILLKDSHLWEEVFLTSSIGLIIPIKKIIRFRSSRNGRTSESNPATTKVSQQKIGQGVDGDFEDDKVEEVWSVNAMDRTCNGTIWREIYNHMIEAASCDEDDE